MTADIIDGLRGTVFLVDDDEGVRKALRRLLSAHGFTVRSFDSAVAFLHSSPVARPACLVADVRMPGMSGLTLQECLRDADSTLPVIFITGHGDLPDAAHALKGGAVAFIQKPFGEEQLLGAVGRALALHERRETVRTREDDARRGSLTPRDAELLAMVTAQRGCCGVADVRGVDSADVDLHCLRLMRRLAVESLVGLRASGVNHYGSELGVDRSAVTRRVAGVREP